MKKQLYLYGVVEANEGKNIGPLGLSTSGTPDEIMLHSHQGLGVIYVEKELEEDEELAASRKNLVNHQRIVELLMQDYTVLPFAFGTLLNDTAAINELVEERKDELEKSLKKIKGKIELNLKILWEDMDVIFEKIISENASIKEKRQYLIDHNIQDQDQKIELGKMVEASLEEKKETMLKQVVEELTPFTVDHKIQKTISDAMFANLAFLINRSDEKEFDQKVNDLSEKMGSNLVFKYVGPMAPVNFI